MEVMSSNGSNATLYVVMRQ